MQSELALDPLERHVLCVRVSSDCSQDEEIVLTGKFDVLYFWNILASEVCVRKRHQKIGNL